jgi:hypothetical protein
MYLVNRTFIRHFACFSVADRTVGPQIHDGTDISASDVFPGYVTFSGEHQKTLADPQRSSPMFQAAMTLLVQSCLLDSLKIYEFLTYCTYVNVHFSIVLEEDIIILPISLHCHLEIARNFMKD